MTCGGGPCLLGTKPIVTEALWPSTTPPFHPSCIVTHKHLSTTPEVVVDTGTEIEMALSYLENRG